MSDEVREGSDQKSSKETYIERTERFDKAKRNFVWFSAALSLVCFASPDVLDAKPLVGIAIAPKWLALALLLAVAYTAWPFAHFGMQVFRLNSRAPIDTADSLETMALSVRSSFASLERKFQNQEQNLEGFKLRIAELDAASITPDAEVIRDQLAKRIQPHYAASRHSFMMELDDMPPGRIDAVSVGRLREQHFDPLPDALAASTVDEFLPLAEADTALRLQNAAAAQDNALATWREDYGQWEEIDAELQSLGLLALDMRRIKEGLAGGEKSLLFGFDLGLPFLLGVFSISLASFTFGSSWIEAARSPEQHIPMLMSPNESASEESSTANAERRSANFKQVAVELRSG